MNIRVVRVRSGRRFAPPSLTVFLTPYSSDIGALLNNPVRFIQVVKAERLELGSGPSFSLVIITALVSQPAPGGLPSVARPAGGHPQIGVRKTVRFTQ